MKSPQDMRIIQIDITNACMYQCSNCTRFCGHHKKNFFMDFETFKRAVDSMKGYHGTIGVMGGEPTLHPEFERFVKYLHSQLPEGIRKDYNALVAPQKDFIESVYLDNKHNSEVYEYNTGARETVIGAGLWSAMVPTYKKYYELIQDTFKFQAVNDHGNVMYHSPILINRKDLQIPDDEWIKIRDNCWAQDIWSATITPKGAFFCEIAGALDMLFDGPGGWPIEEGWWRRTPDQFGDQLKWCELCGIAVETFTRNANDWIDDVSESMYKRLEEIGSPKLKKEGRINKVKIENGVIAEESKVGALEIRKDLFYDSFMSRFNEGKSVLYPEGFTAIVDLPHNVTRERTISWLEKNGKLFDQIFLLVKSGKDVENWRDISFENCRVCRADTVWGNAFSIALRNCKELKPIIYVDGIMDFNEKALDKFRETIINPGTLHVSDLRTENSDLVLNVEVPGKIAMFHKEASSLKTMGLDRVSNAKDFSTIENCWISAKYIKFDSSVIEDTSGLRIQQGKKYAMYGAGITGKNTLQDIQKIGATVVMVVDSNPQKWGADFEGFLVVSPDELVMRRAEYDQIVIASTFYKEIKNTLKEKGFTEEEYITHE